MSSTEEGLECLHKPILSGILSTLRLNLLRVQILTGRDFLYIYTYSKIRKKTFISKLNNYFITEKIKHHSFTELKTFFYPVIFPFHSNHKFSDFLPSASKHLPPRVNITFTRPESTMDFLITE